MAMIKLVVRERLSGADLDVEIDDGDTVGKLAEGLRKELQLPERDAKGGLIYKLVHTRTGLLLGTSQTLRQAGVQNDDALSFWGEPTAAALSLFQRRLANEFQEVLARFGPGVHPNVRVAHAGSPPSVYTVTYLMKAPVSRVGGALTFGTEHRLQITLPPEYPDQPPALRMLTPVCHPNIGSQGQVCIGNDFHSGQGVCVLIAKIGNYLQFREFGHESAYDRELSGLVQAGGLGPCDSVSFEPKATE